MIELNIQKFAGDDTDPNNNGGDPANQNGGNGTGTKTYTQEELDKIVNDRTGRATKSALTSFFKQKGLTEEEANNAMATYLENKKKSTPDVAELQNTINSERSARLSAEINQSATLEAIKQGIDVKSIPYVLKMADFKAVTDADGKVNAEKLTEAIKTVLDDIPALKGASQSGGNNGGIQKIGGDGDGSDKVTEDALRGIFGIKSKN
ncbi:MAG TPA: hypothetical protein DD413_09215 [Ruminococcus sp.]|nr:hypothetical protein [Ruminococcus sp.]